MNLQEPITTNPCLRYETDPNEIMNSIRNSRIAELEEKTDDLFGSFPLKLKQYLQKEHKGMTGELKIISKIQLVARGNVNNIFDFDGIENVLDALEVDVNDPVFKIHRDAITIYIKIKVILFQMQYFYQSLDEKGLTFLYEDAKTILPDAIDSTAEQRGIKSTKSKAALAKNTLEKELKLHLIEISKTKKWDWNDRPSWKEKEERRNILIKEYNYKGCRIKKKRGTNKYYFYHRKKGHFLILPNATNLSRLFRNFK